MLSWRRVVKRLRCRGWRSKDVGRGESGWGRGQNMARGQDIGGGWRGHAGVNGWVGHGGTGRGGSSSFAA